MCVCVGGGHLTLNGRTACEIQTLELCKFADHYKTLISELEAASDIEALEISQMLQRLKALIGEADAALERKLLQLPQVAYCKSAWVMEDVWGTYDACKGLVAGVY